jgi:hypothetical protein
VDKEAKTGVVVTIRAFLERIFQVASSGWFGPVDETVVERLKAKAYQTRDEGENLMHSVRNPL